MPYERKIFHVVTGMHRSGTTLTGQILGKYPELHIIHEPLNMEYGLNGIRNVYPCDMDMEQRHYYLGLLERLLSGEASYVRSVAKDSLAKALVRKVIGGNTGYDMAKFRLRKLVSPSLKPVFKDSFEILLAQSLMDDGKKVIALVRHPAAIWLSIKRMEWRFSYANFAYPDIFTVLGIRLPVTPLDDMPEIKKFAWLWTAIYTYLDRLRGNDRLLLLRHEDLCVRPYEELQRIETFLGVAPRQEARDFIARNMFAEVATVDGKQLHVFERDSRRLSISWHGRLSAEEETIIRAICGPLVERYYGRWTPV